MAKKELIDPSGFTRGSLDYWAAHKGELGNIQKARCGGQGGKILEIEGTEGVMRLTGCTCGYGGEGPQGTAEVLKDIGVSHQDAVELMQLEAFQVLVQCCRD